ncbi:MAG: hypothetical protein WC450_05295 [Candidatus Omnitrophota bacterium]
MTLKEARAEVEKSEQEVRKILLSLVDKDIRTARIIVTPINGPDGMVAEFVVHFEAYLK